MGLSGGIDSSLTAAIAVMALGRESVTGVLMPSPYTSLDSREDAEELAKNLGIRFEDIPISGIFNSYLETLESFLQGPGSDLAVQNLQARIRGNLLMALANKDNSVVLTTGNKSELSVGYATLYGDLAGGFAVLKDVPKTLVYLLSDYCNQAAGKNGDTSAGDGKGPYRRAETRSEGRGRPAALPAAGPGDRAVRGAESDYPGDRRAGV